MDTYVLDFSSPIQGLDGLFNTVRLGVRLSRVLEPGRRVLLVEKPRSVLIGTAIVQQVELGTLADIAARYAAMNHNQKHEAEGAPARLVQNMVRRYGPHKCGENSRVTMILLLRDR